MGATQSAAPAPVPAGLAPEPEPVPELFDQDVTKPRRTLHGFLLALALLVLAAVLGLVLVVFHQSSRPAYPVGGLVGMDVGEARNRIATYGWKVKEVHEKNDQQPLDKVFKTDPASGNLAKGQAFTLYVSDGPTPSVLPTLVGEKLASATAALKKLQLQVTQAPPQFSETAPAGTILAFTVAGQQVPEGAAVDKGSTVSVVVSAGPKPRTVPSLTGQAPTPAEQALKRLGLVPAKGPDVFNALVPKGRVAVTQPSAGAKVPKGAKVTYQLSKGADLVVVPNLTGLRLQQAKATLARAGLTLGKVSGDPAGPVYSATPGSGTKVLRGTAVTLVLFP
jgi:beta-lactam-binding protein with PASTA domain